MSAHERRRMPRPMMVLRDASDKHIVPRDIHSAESQTSIGCSDASLKLCGRKYSQSGLTDDRLRGQARE
jgi:hypothetical protein